MLLYMDVHVPFAITAGLRLRGVDVVTAQEDGMAELDDDVLLDRVTALGRVIFTRDVDFLTHARERQTNGVTFSGVVYAHQLGASIGQCVNDLELIAKGCEPEYMIESSAVFATLTDISDSELSNEMTQPTEASPFRVGVGLLENPSQLRQAPQLP